ncbi:alpha-aminoadipic semialdehyde synthase, mitochondrial-like isoform X2 [Argiope bruennichi]|nr:alpha-aminoadipic semialdehyde synthase, mitochondrial-like isoform X2 [Argiope bruennichi]XP_055948927.1 alpha-aminoadipic semialdehyde synthase, mitochondrial-like isoform X2 [Argiope bruennichi]XP_055948928.1 alpha-aminoadipic semialdehyde synthase, mitochondrial-like isoform X2 [Argiope bruennichi]XP_055948929.1 alpha-aminoadipic semialdehyde synthase, mitochondrial-like isoform X2 [Argiope bruennichi]
MWHIVRENKCFSSYVYKARSRVPQRWKSSGKVLAVRREDASVWERRAPLAPHHVKQLTKEGVKVLVQPSNRRAYPMQAYINAGAIIQEDISEAPVIIGVKQVPIDSLLPNKTYCFFSHTIKAQEANMPMLDCILERNIRLIDYEKLVDSKGQRVVAFGKFAGVAGIINILHGLGLRLLALGHHTPFMHVGPAHNYRNSGMARQTVRDAGYEIALGMMPRSIGPLTFVFTGSGNVSQGAQEVFQELPYEYVSPTDLPQVAEHGSMNKVYGAVVSRDDHFRRKEGGGFDAEEYEAFPERYYSNFAKTIAPYASVIINGIYWAVNSPKLLTIPDAKHLLRPSYTPWLPSSAGSPSLPHRLLAICDISADPGGSIEFMSECTTIDTPFCLYDADQHKNSESFSGPGVLVCSIDNMPTQLPLEATDYFGYLLYPYMDSILSSDATKPLENLNFGQTVEGAIIASNGKLTPNFEYIQELRNTSTSQMKARSMAQNASKKVLVLGAGYVAEPLIDYLTKDQTIHVIIGSSLQNQGEALVKSDNAEHVVLDVTTGRGSLDKLIEDSNLVISLLPYSLHPTIAERCIKHKVNMVTASYLTPEMRNLHEAAMDAGITVVNEVGLDPGIDHLLAMECFDEIKLNGGKITSFVSFCGGLPAPEYSDNPLRYKFSWNPRGVLLNTLSVAKYLEDGKIVEIPSGGALMDHVRNIDFLPGFNLEGYPNRDSTVYSTLYNIQSAHTVLRGTLRYKGFADVMKALHKLGLLSDAPHPCLHSKGPEITWKQFLCTLLGQQDQEMLTPNLKNLIYDVIGKSESQVAAIERLGILAEEAVVKCSTPLDTLTHFLANKLAIQKGERDVIILRHNIGIQWPDNKNEMRNIDFVVYGDKDGYSAMAKTVGYPAAIAAKMVLENEIQTRGMVVPMVPEIYKPMLMRLKQEGISSLEHTFKL